MHSPTSHQKTNNNISDGYGGKLLEIWTDRREPERFWDTSGSDGPDRH